MYHESMRIIKKSNARKILITGGAGFIGFHLAAKLISDDHNVVILDSMTDYYDVNLKWDRVNELKEYGEYEFIHGSISDAKLMDDLFAKEQFEIVINLAGQSGVRYSTTNPIAFAEANLLGMTVVIDCVKRHQVKHLVYASSSSVYGGNTKLPNCESDELNNQLSFYALTKRTNENMAKLLTDSTGIPTTGCRFFTVYGPFGRPDMAYWKFSENILSGTPITLYGDGELARSFTYCEDIVNALERLLMTSRGTARVVNIGSEYSCTVQEMITTLEQLYGKTAIIEHTKTPYTEPQITQCDPSLLYSYTRYKPDTQLPDGLRHFAKWFVKYRK